MKDGNDWQYCAIEEISYTKVKKKTEKCFFFFNFLTCFFSLIWIGTWKRTCLMARSKDHTQRAPPDIRLEGNKLSSFFLCEFFEFFDDLLLKNRILFAVHVWKLLSRQCVDGSFSNHTKRNSWSSVKCCCFVLFIFLKFYD